MMLGRSGLTVAGLHPPLMEGTAMAERTGLGSISAHALRAELNRRQHGLRRLEKQHDRLSRKLATLERQMADLGGSVNGHSTHPRNKESLVEVLDKVLKGKTLG